MVSLKAGSKAVVTRYDKIGRATGSWNPTFRYRLGKAPIILSRNSCQQCRVLKYDLLLINPREWMRSRIGCNKLQDQELIEAVSVTMIETVAAVPCILKHMLVLHASS